MPDYLMEISMSRFAKAALGIALTLSGCTPPSLAAQTVSCYTGLEADAFAALTRRKYAAVGADSIGWKANGFPFATGNAIQLVTDPAVCDSAVAAVNQLRSSWGMTGTIVKAFVVKIGISGYVVSTIEDAAGEFRPNYWFDSAWTLKQTI